MRKYIRSQLALLRGQMSDWIHSPRTIIMAILILLFTFMNAKSYNAMLESSHLISYAGEAFYVYLSSGFGSITLTSALLLIMMSEIPRQVSFQSSMLIRSSRSKWLWSQMLFCFTVVALMMMLMLVCSMMLTLPYLSHGSGWSDLDRIAANPDAQWDVQLVPEYIRRISPLQASIYAGLILFAFWFVMFQIILAFSLAGKPNLGLILYVFLLVLHITVMWERIPGFRSPANFSTIAAVANMYPEYELQAIPTVLFVYAGIALVLITVMHIQVRNKDLQFIRKDGV